MEAEARSSRSSWEGDLGVRVRVRGLEGEGVEEGAGVGVGEKGEEGWVDSE